jgi:hypothetical protein
MNGSGGTVGRDGRVARVGDVWVADKGEHKGYKQLVVAVNEHHVRVKVQARHTGDRPFTMAPAQFYARHRLLRPAK